MNPPNPNLNADLARLILPSSPLRAGQGFLRNAEGATAGFSLARGRVHELCGPSRAALAAFVLAECTGTVLWIVLGWQPERINPQGLLPYADPHRVIFARIRRPEDALWAMEEGLRSGAAPVVLADLQSPPALTPIRRLHLAAEMGAEAAQRHGRPAPLGLLLTPDMGGAQGIESRWHIAPAPSPLSAFERGAAWRLERLRARTAPPAAWGITRRGSQVSVQPQGIAP